MFVLGVIDSLCSVYYMVLLIIFIWLVIVSRGLLDLCFEIIFVLISCLFNLFNFFLINLFILLVWVCVENVG